MQLLPEQREALAEIQALCREAGVQVVIIGATAYRLWVPDKDRTTEDLDLAVAMDLDQWQQLTDRLKVGGWQQDRAEHRWLSPRGARVDLLPAGETARREREIVWPVSQSRMSLVGFDQVFARAVRRAVGPQLEAEVVPLPVLVLLKIVSFLEKPYQRSKDLEDIARILHLYELNTERRHSDDVYEAREVGVDYDSAGAYLLGLDLGQICNAPEEILAVQDFLAQISDEEHPTYWSLLQYSPDRLRESEDPVRQQVEAFRRGFLRSSPPSPPPARGTPRERPRGRS